MLLILHNFRCPSLAVEKHVTRALLPEQRPGHRDKTIFGFDRQRQQSTRKASEPVGHDTLRKRKPGKNHGHVTCNMTQAGQSGSAVPWLACCFSFMLCTVPSVGTFASMTLRASEAFSEKPMFRTRSLVGVHHEAANINTRHWGTGDCNGPLLALMTGDPT